jgi:hypothetical protein
MNERSNSNTLFINYFIRNHTILGLSQQVNKRVFGNLNEKEKSSTVFHMIKNSVGLKNKHLTDTA